MSCGIKQLDLCTKVKALMAPEGSMYQRLPCCRWLLFYQPNQRKQQPK